MLLYLHNVLSAAVVEQRLGHEGRNFKTATQSLVDLCGLMDSRGRRLNGRDCETLLRHWKSFCAATEAMEALHTPKRHSVGHMLCQSPLKGNPRLYSNWVDEGLNRVLKKACRQLSQATFEHTILLTMPTLLNSAMSQ